MCLKMLFCVYIIVVKMNRREFLKKAAVGTAALASPKGFARQPMFDYPCSKKYFPKGIYALKPDISGKIYGKLLSNIEEVGGGIFSIDYKFSPISLNINGYDFRVTFDPSTHTLTMKTDLLGESFPEVTRILFGKSLKLPLRPKTLYPISFNFEVPRKQDPISNTYLKYVEVANVDHTAIWKSAVEMVGMGAALLLVMSIFMLPSLNFQELENL